ncbi:MAG TPA: hypothetical protein VFW75_13260 [Acetobacteraceae bacterium]|nr:hypothetical protein [Acetobacteraceae bacterium]
MSQAVMGAHGSDHELIAERQVLGGRTMSQGLFGIIAVILGIVGLAIAAVHPNVPMYLDAIAAIALGLSLIMVGTGFAAAYGRLVARVEGAAGGQMMGTTVGMFLGGAVVILGILALLRVASPVLVPIQVILIGTGLILNSAASVRLATLEGDVAIDRTPARRVGEEMVFATASVRAIAGIAVGILGILGLVGTADALVLTLAAMIVGGAALVLNSTSLSRRMIGVVIPHTP